MSEHTDQDLLSITELAVAYGQVPALRGVSIAVREGESIGLAGANAAGKSTLLRAVSGLLKPKAGDIRLGGTSVLGTRPYEVARLGIAHVPEGRRLFWDLTVLENLKLGALGSGRAGNLDRVLELFPHLRSRLRQVAGSLSGGEQQMVAIGRGLMADPRLLMIDELSLGLAPKIVQQLYETLRHLNVAYGVTMLVVDQNLQALPSLACRVYVLNRGSVAVEMTAEELRGNPRAIEAYLGKT